MMHVDRTVAAPLERIWRILADTELWPVWGPSIRRVESPQRFLCAGLSGRLQTLFGLWLPFTITRFEPPYDWGWSVAGIPATGHRLQRCAVERCVLTFVIPYGAFFYKPVCRRAAETIERLALENCLDPLNSMEASGSFALRRCAGGKG